MVVCGRNLSNCGGCMDVDNSNPGNARKSEAPIDSNGYLTQKATMDVKELVKN
jgi:hypothetical protein